MIPDFLKGKRLVLFGAGRVARLFFSRFPELNVVAFADNDSSKHGTLVGHVPVVAPSRIGSLNYDLVVISTGWWESISAQLQELGVPSEKVMLPPKSLLAINSGIRPFSDAATKVLAIDMMRRVARFSAAYDIPIMLDFGTLLGAARDGDLIAWDDDIDFSINDAEFPLLVDHLADLKSLLPDREEFTADISIVRSEEAPVGVFITLKSSPGHVPIVPFEIGFMRRVFEGDKSITKSSGPEFIAPERHFRSVDKMQFLGVQFCTPHDALGYLTFVYGDWQTPKQNVTLADYPMQEPEYREVSISKF
ncbi:LicD family protein [Halopseudomonas pachastrellae]|uniref:LicD family protein n=1 Tax=Halopseudomonas pachastrellae TaxID=254161 RepID=UPI003D7E6A42